MISRRSLFRSGPVAAAAPPAGSLWQQHLSAAGAADPADEGFWSAVRAEFPLEENLIYLNAPNVCPASNRVAAKHLEYLRDFYAKPSFENRGKYEAAAFLSKVGMANVQARSLYLAGYLKEKLLAVPGLQMLTPAEPSLSAAVLKFRLAGRNTRQLGAELWSRRRISGAVTSTGPLEGIRWCPHVYNTREELDRAVEALRSLL